MGLLLLVLTSKSLAIKNPRIIASEEKSSISFFGNIAESSPFSVSHSLAKEKISANDKAFVCLAAVLALLGEIKLLLKNGGLVTMQS